MGKEFIPISPPFSGLGRIERKPSGIEKKAKEEKRPFQLPDGKIVNLYPKHIRVISLIELAKNEKRVISDDEIKRFANPPDFKQGNGVFNMSIHHINHALAKEGWEIKTEDPRPGKDWSKRRRRVLQKIDPNKSKKNVELKKQPDLKKIVQEMLLINDDTYKKLQIGIANKIILAFFENEINSLEKSPAKLLLTVLNEIYEKEYERDRKNNKGETIVVKKEIKIDKKFTPERIEHIKNFIFKSIEEPVDEYEDASEEELKKRTQLQIRLRNTKIILGKGMPLEREKLINQILNPLRKHFS